MSKHRIHPPQSTIGWIGTGVVSVLLIFGVVALVIGIGAQRNPPEPPLTANAQSVTPTPTSSASGNPIPAPSGSASSSPRPTSPTSQGTVLDRSVPTSISIPSINVRSSLLQLGLNKDRTIQVPPLARDSKAGWYKYSPTPGQLGPSVILGHIDSAEYGPGIFYKLGALHPGDGVDVTRTDGTVVRFTVTKAARYPKKNFPTQTVYGNIDHAGLRLITCGGSFDSAKHSYRDNIVIYATLTSVHKTG